MKKRAGLDLTQGPVLRTLLMFALPVMLTSILNNLYSAADMIMIGKLRDTASMAAVGACSHPITLTVNFFNGVGMGVTVVCANLRGARKERELRECMHTAIGLGFFSGLLVALLGIFGSRPLLTVMGTPGTLLDDAVLYMTIRLAAGPIFVLNTYMNNILHAHGDTRSPMLIGLTGGALNVAFNTVFVLFCGMDVEGVAIATVISQVYGFCVRVFLLFGPKGKYAMKLRSLSLRMKYIRNILAVGIPTGINNTVFSISNVLLQSSVNSFGPEIVAGNSAADKISVYVSLFMTAFNSATLSATSQCYGAHKFKRMDEIAVKSCIGCVVMVLATSAVVTLFARPLLSLFVNTNEENWQQIVEKGIPKLMFCSWGYSIYSFATTFSSCLKGIRKATPALVCNLGGIIVPRLIWIWFVVPYMHTPNMLYAIYPISWVISSVMLGIMFVHYRRKLASQMAVPAVT